MSNSLPRIILKSCPKNYCLDLDKAISPQETIKQITRKLLNAGGDIYAGARRIDAGRLGIPVYMGLCGRNAREIMPVRKQMGKGSSQEQAQASALMELMERYAFFSFWKNPPHCVQATWSEAQELFGENLLPISQMLLSVNDHLPEEKAKKLLDLRRWLFYPATEIASCKNVWLPIDWFRMLGEFNGSSAGNTNEESILQGLSELIERHVCAIIDAQRPILPTIDTANCSDPTLQSLVRAFQKNNINLVLKDFSLDMPMPTVGAIAWDETTFPHASEIVFTAGTASSPAKAAIRAITEVAQLGGDFCTNSCYEASGLPKFNNIDEIAWLKKGPVINLDSLPSIASNDIYEELQTATGRLKPIKIYAIETTCPELDIPAHYCVAPGLQFRERDKNQSLGLFIGRKLAEEANPQEAVAGLKILSQVVPNAHYLQFFQGMAALRCEDYDKATKLFADAITKQPDDDSKSLAAFYAGYTQTQNGNWAEAVPYLDRALKFSPQLKEAANLLGVAYFKQAKYARAENYFSLALKLDKGSAIDLANRGLARKYQGKSRDAAADLTAALELDPTLEFAKDHLLQLQQSL